MSQASKGVDGTGVVGDNNFGIIPPYCMVGLASTVPTKLRFLFHKERLLFGALLNAYQTDRLVCPIYTFSQSLQGME